MTTFDFGSVDTPPESWPADGKSLRSGQPTPNWTVPCMESSANRPKLFPMLSMAAGSAIARRRLWGSARLSQGGTGRWLESGEMAEPPPTSLLPTER